MRIINVLFFKEFYEFLISYPVSLNLTYFWNFGIYSLVCLFIQICSGLFLAMFYIPNQDFAFISIEHIMRDIELGWLLRYIHANGASLFFIVVYIHIFRGLFFSSFLYPRTFVWISGIFIFLLMIITAFLGYVLPWGQMSFWAATVITNLVTAIPKIGTDLVIWLWGGYAVDNATLNRFYSFHFLLPFIILGLVFIHLIFLHRVGSSNLVGIEFFEFDLTFMYPYYIVKDLYGIIIFFFFFSIFLFFFPNFLGHTDNYIPANPLVTPVHIVPEWYFLPFYAILRSIPNKLFGVLIMLCSILVFFFLPFILKIEVRSLLFRPLSRFFFWFFIVLCILLGWLGSMPANEPYVFLSQVVTSLYFSFFFFFFPLVCWIEYFFWNNNIYLCKFESLFVNEK